MKVEQKVLEKPKFVPITITIETAQEYFELLAALAETSVKDVENGLLDRGLHHLLNRNKHFAHEKLYGHLGQLFSKVKGTL